ncbi:MAG: gliding motility-associated ABC transporter substrate-binding protein GldG [Flavobacteriales bacterium]|nr:gliding motility-associated ABC transporter substrate-binding protein GldG [Flavobacteriales bacterium]MBK7941557.1 gliding motility-associated ABC transporter substrate-binding protein GldG [Flavobacteriales bacterium]MBK9700102.1 gliding motility-associated ABC transporter substrate-binding protein GldG [Flavobacteriales bacterium]
MARPGRSPRLRDLTELVAGVGIVLLLLFIVGFVRLRADLTSEERYTLKDTTRELIAGLDDRVYVKVYLAGDLPADLRRLSEATRELLDEMRVHGPDKLDHSFIDPSADPDAKVRQEVYATLEKQGLQYSSIRIREKDGHSEKIVFPGALVTYKGRTVAVQLLKTQLRTPDADMVNRSINNLEFELGSAIRQLTRKERPRIAFLEGHGELEPIQVRDVATLLGEHYDVSRLRIDGQLGSLSDRLEGARYRTNRWDLLIVAKPDSAFPEKDLYILDQYVMNGGKVLWLLDAMNANLDSLRSNQYSMATAMELGVDQLLFAYGVRINNDLLLDRSCAPIEIFTTPYGNQRKLERFPWYFEPVLIPQEGHPIVNNIDPVHTRFVSSMDTIGTDSIRKTILLTTSPYNRVLRNPVRVALNIVELQLGLDKKGTPAPVAVLLEGPFTSAFAGRLTERFLTEGDPQYRAKGRPTSQLVISDGDVIENRVDPAKGMYYMLGYDRYANAKIYGNRELLVNAVNYLLDDQSLISLRSRAITLRQLDPVRSVGERTFWQVVNLVVPSLVVILAGLLFHLLRKRRYTKPA